jgi:hypothetical protein
MLLNTRCPSTRFLSSRPSFSKSHAYKLQWVGSRNVLAANDAGESLQIRFTKRRPKMQSVPITFFKVVEINADRRADLRFQLAGRNMPPFVANKHITKLGRIVL